MNGCAPSLALIERLRSTRKCAICIHVYGDCNAILPFTSRKKISTFAPLSRYICSYIKTNGLSQYQTRTTVV